MLGSPILYLKGMRILMFQLSGFYYKKRRMPQLLAESTQRWGRHMSAGRPETAHPSVALWGLGFKVWGLGFSALRFRVWGLRCGV